MKEYAIKIMNLAELISLNRYVRKHHIKGTVVQKNFKARADSFLGLLIALPLDSATLIVEQCDEVSLTELMNYVQAA